MTRTDTSGISKHILHGISFLFSFLISCSFIYAQSAQRMLLSFHSEGSMHVLGAYGPASVTNKAEGYVYLIPGPEGTFSGTGRVSATIEFGYPKNGTVSISPLYGEGQFQVEGKIEGNYLRFHFKHKEIPCKGEIVVNYPAPMGTKKQPYEDDFDPQVIAPGEEPGVKIELKDGATESVEFVIPSSQNANWKTDFTLNEAEMWRVAVEGEETDTTVPPIENRKLKTKDKELPIALKYKWNLVGEFVVIGKGNARRYHDGDIFSSMINHQILFDFQDLYSPEMIPCKETWQPEDLIGRSIKGKVSGSSVRLEWPEFTPKDCYFLRPLKSYLGRLQPRKEFASKEFIGYISREDLPLVDGNVVTGGVSDWLNYSIKLIKIQ